MELKGGRMAKFINLWFFIGFFLSFLHNTSLGEEKSFFLFVAGRNNYACYKKNLDSIFSQKYDNYKVIYVDDASDDGTGELVKRYIQSRGLEERVILLLNKERCYKMANQYRSIYSFCQDNDIVVEIDADDWFPHDQVLSYLNKIYSNEDIWITHGKFMYYPSGELGASCKYPEEVICKNKFREYKWLCSGLRTYYTWLFKLIKKEDLIYKGKDSLFQGKFIPDSSDLAIMFPMLEMSRNGHIRFIDSLLHICNRDRLEVYDSRMKEVRSDIVFNHLKKIPPYNMLE